jgi:2-methylcitrate dehydratase PrpD
MLTPKSAAETIARFCTKADFASLPKEVVEKTKIHILDGIGAALAGSCRQETRNLIQLAEEWGGKPESTLITSRSKVPMVNAALVNGEMSHDTGLDDVYPSAALHPASVVIPSAFAAAEKKGHGGPAFITAVVLGYDIMLRIGESIGPKALYHRGFHPTGICGPFGSVVAAGKLLGLDQDQFTRALGIAGSQAGGLMEFLSDGSSVKRLHPARASQSGALSAVLAEAGHSGPATVLEGSNGFFKAYADRPYDADLLAGLGMEFKIMQTGLKVHPCTRYIEPSLNIVSDLQKRHKIDYREIEEVTIHIFDAAFPIVVEPIEEKRRPQNAFSGQFSLPYSVAAALVKGRLTYAVDALRSEEIAALTDKIRIIPDPEMSSRFPKWWPTRMTIQDRHGNVWVGEVPTAKGDPENFLSLDEVFEKFSGLARAVFPGDQVDRIMEAVMTLERVRDVSRLGDLLRR